MDFADVENKDGVRFSWNQWPNSRVEAARMVIPFGCVYTPLKDVENLQLLTYPPVVCKNPQCQSVLNPHW